MRANGELDGLIFGEARAVESGDVASGEVFEWLAVVGQCDCAGGAGDDLRGALVALAVTHSDLENVGAAVRDRRAGRVDRRVTRGVEGDEVDGGGAGFFGDGDGDGSGGACRVNAVAGIFGNDGIGCAAGQLSGGDRDCAAGAGEGEGAAIFRECADGEGRADGRRSGGRAGEERNGAAGGGSR